MKTKNFSYYFLIINIVIEFFEIGLLCLPTASATLSLSMTSSSEIPSNFDREIKSEIDSLDLSSIKQDVSFDQKSFTEQEIKHRRKLEIKKQKEKSSLFLEDKTSTVLIAKNTPLFFIKTKEWFKTSIQFWATGYIKASHPQLIFFTKNNLDVAYTKLKYTTSLDKDLNLFPSHKLTTFAGKKTIVYPKLKLYLIPQISFGVSTISTPFYKNLYSLTSGNTISQDIETSILFSTSFPVGVKTALGYQQYSLDSVKILSSFFNIGFTLFLSHKRDLFFSLLSSRSISSHSSNSIDSIATQFEGYQIGIQKNWDHYSISFSLENRTWSVNSTNNINLNVADSLISSDKLIGFKLSYCFNNLI